nr:transposase, MuDR, MULE transposase domain protein [Tanacetum cinerariifolium]
MLVGNKVDKESERFVSKEEGNALAKELGCLFFECSATTLENVHQCFEELALKIMEVPSLVEEGSTTFKKNILGNIPAARLTPDDNEARSDWWISSKAYFDGFINQVERVPSDLSRKNMYEISFDIYRQFVEQKIKLERNKKDVDDTKEEMLKFREEMNARPVRQENTVPIIVGQHYGFSDFSQFQSMQGGLSLFKGHSNSSFFNMVPSHIGRPNLQTTIQTQHDVDGIVDHRVSKTKNKGKKSNLSPLNLGGVLEGYNEEENNVTFLEDLTYSMLHEMVMQKFNLEANAVINLSFKLSSFDFAIDITDDAEIRTFLNYLRLVLMIDAAHLKGLYKGTNLVAVVMDGNNQIMPIAFGICKGETGPCWSWWMSVLKECIGDNPNLLFISDRHDTIDLAVEKEFPLAFHAPDAHEKLCRAGPQRWSRAHGPLVRYNYITSNSVDSVMLVV